VCSQLRYTIVLLQLSLVTTDVQPSAAFVALDTVTIECLFIPGTLSKGCHVRLLGSDHSMKAHNIVRIGGLDSVRKVLPATVAPADILVFDWERDGSIGNIPVPVDITRASSTVKPSGSGTSPYHTAGPSGLGTGNHRMSPRANNQNRKIHA
jgi:hypothetical protein